MLRTVARTVRRFNLFNEGETVIVAVSGGADSVALLDILALSGNHRLNLIVAHLNHSLRGVESDEDEQFVSGLASHYGVEVVTKRVDVERLSNEKRMSLEQAGRFARHQFFDEVRSGCSADKVALAHHADDQAETVLLRLIRGAATTGLAAMSPNGNGYIRPLLEVTRKEIERYCAERKLTYRTDSSNSDLRFLRNRIRHDLIPYLAGYNPAIAERLVATASALSADEALLETITDDIFSRTACNEANGVVLAVDGIRDEPLALRMRLYRRSIQMATGDLARIAYCHLEAIDELVQGRKPNLKLALPGPLAVTRRYGELLFHHPSEEAEQVRDDFLIEGPGTYPLSVGGEIVVGFTAAPLSFTDVPATVAYFNPDDVTFPWHLRTFRNGDRFTPSGASGGKKLKDFFIDNKIPPAQRLNTPLLYCGRRLLWVCGIRLGSDPALRLTGSMAWRVEIVST